MFALSRESTLSPAGFDVYKFILTNLKESVKPTDHATFFKTYTQCWTAADAITILAKQNNMSREEAVEIGRKLLEQGGFERVTGSGNFEDCADLFRFPGATPVWDETRERSQSFESVFSGVLDKFFSKTPEQLRFDLRKACENDNATVACQILSQNKLNVDDPLDDKGWTALHFAAREGASNIVTILNRDFLADANIDTAFVYDVGESWTPLMMAAYSGKLGVVTALCENCRVDPFITDELGRTALEIARLYGRNLCARYLSQLEELSVTLVDPEMSPQSPDEEPYDYNVFNEPFLEIGRSIPVGFSSLSRGLSHLDEMKEYDSESSGLDPVEERIDPKDKRIDPKDKRIAELEAMLAKREKENEELKNLLSDEVVERKKLQKTVELLKSTLKGSQSIIVKHHLGIDRRDDDIDSE